MEIINKIEKFFSLNEYYKSSYSIEHTKNKNFSNVCEKLCSRHYTKRSNSQSHQY